MVSLFRSSEAAVSKRSFPVPKEGGKNDKVEFCNQYAKWLLQNPTSTANRIDNNSSQDLQGSAQKKKRQRDVEDGADIWMKAALEKGLEGVTNYSAAIQLYDNTVSASEIQDDEPTQLCILKYPVPEYMVSEHGSDASVMVLFAAGMHRLLYPVFHPPGKTRRQPLPMPFTLQALQDKFTGCKRKIPIPVLAKYCLFYTEKGWFRNVDAQPKVSAGLLFQTVTDLPMDLTKSDLLEIAKSL
jgi:hypothetical protein